MEYLVDDVDSCWILPWWCNFAWNDSKFACSSEYGLLMFVAKVYLM